MRALREQAERIGREAADRRIDELAATIAARLPRAEVERLADGLSVRDLRLLNRWIDDIDLRFLGSAR